MDSGAWWAAVHGVTKNQTQQYMTPDLLEIRCNAGDPGEIPGLGRSTGKGNGNPLQYYCLENPMDRGTWQATVHAAWLLLL